MTIFIALSLIFVFINARLKKRLLRLEINNANKTIQTNNKEMAAATLKLLQNSEKDNHCLKLLEEIESKVNNENKDMVKNLMSHYRKKSDDSNWAEFDTLFKKVSPKFYDKLNDLYPNLTPNERKLCVFLKLNMTNKDITKITFQSEEALKKARLRLRKKLNLERDINLSSFMQTL